jgi:hypothetical protein
LRAIEQFEAAGNDGHVDLQPLFFELVGCGRCNPATVPNDGPLFLAVENRKMEFNPAGAYDTFSELAERIALNIAKVPDLLRGTHQPTPRLIFGE